MTAKRITDLVGASVALTLLSPAMGAVALAIRASMGAPVLFRHVRPGLHGKPFEMLKFRTMRTPEPNQAGPRDEERLTPLGRFLRAASLDELPTLLNVLKGEMSLVGPRPLLMAYLSRYSPEQARRHDVKPGMTGWAQVNGRNEHDWETKLAHDTWYVDNWSYWLDLWILIRTAGTVLRRDGISRPGHATAPEFTGSERAS